MTKFSYIFSVRIVPVGTPVLTIRPSLTVNVFGATLTGTQPDKSLPLNSGTKSSARVTSAGRAASQTRQAEATRRMVDSSVLGGNAIRAETTRTDTIFHGLRSSPRPSPLWIEG